MYGYNIARRSYIVLMIHVRITGAIIRVLGK